MKFKHLIIFAAIFRLVIAPLASHIDLATHADWGIRFFDYGFKGFYAPDANVWSYNWPNQPPGAIYLFIASRLIFQFLFSILLFINSNIGIFPSIIVSFSENNLYPVIIKMIGIFSDFGIAYLIFKIVGHPEFISGSIPKRARDYSRFAALLFLFNPVVWYNSAVWGQLDSTIGFFALLSFYLVFKNKLSLGVLAFLISIYIKVSLIIFAPILGIYILRKFKLKQILYASILPISIIILSTLPFLNRYTPNPFEFLHFVYTKKVLTDQMHVITANAFNFWGALTGLELQSHDKIFLVFSLKAWGYILGGLAILPTIYSVYKKPKQKVVVWALAITAFSIFMLFTNMHERYIYPLFPYLTILVAQNRKLLIPYLAISLITILNMYNLWWVPEIEVIKNILENMLVLRLISIFNLGLFMWFYKHFLFDSKAL